MAPSKAISIELKAQQQAILQRELESGHYENASEVIGDALRALHERGTAYDEFLRARVKASLANKKPSIPAEVVFARLEARHARKKDLEPTWLDSVESVGPSRPWNT